LPFPVSIFVVYPSSLFVSLIFSPIPVVVRQPSFLVDVCRILSWPFFSSFCRRSIISPSSPHFFFPPFQLDYTTLSALEALGVFIFFTFFPQFAMPFSSSPFLPPRDPFCPE